MEPLLKARNLSKKFNQHFLFKDLDLDIFPGDTISIVGRSGEGKSTLLHLLGALDSPTDGTLWLNNHKLTYASHRARNQEIGFVFQSFHLLEDYTVLENVMMPAWIANTTEKATPRAHELLEKVGLLAHANQPTKNLSGGEKQRVAIARAFLNNPSLILADEPSGNLDKATAALIHDLLLSFTKEGNKSLVVVTHDLDLAALCQKQLRLTEGKLKNI